ncbi:MAG TPA: class IV adenylate cyclase [Sedimentisphaerales bacterium]|nr:class IV adenylate cyclase [Sedimentisphaerales bacterium]
MAYEIEAKLKCDRHEDLKKALKAAGAEFLGESMQHDIYLDDASGSIRAMDGALRIRQESPGGKAQLTLKGPHEVSSLKKRTEVNVGIASVLDAEAILSGLGYIRRITVEKKRSAWRLCGCDVALDELPLIGRFVEIEGPDETSVNKVQEMLGLARLEHIPQSYAALIEEQTQQQ